MVLTPLSAKIPNLQLPPSQYCLLPAEGRKTPDYHFMQIGGGTDKHPARSDRFL
jgi:hypothetical protein